MEPQLAEQSKSKNKTAQAKILIIDDEPDCVSIIRHRLEQANYETITASDGTEGLQKAAAEKPDLILLDTNMPIMGGWAVLNHLRKDPALKNIPVIMVTARAEVKDVSTASSFGITDYITKPFEHTEMMEKIANAIKKTYR